MSFKEDKARYMKELSEESKDLSKKGYVDPQIRPLLDAINSLDTYYTTSSCAGRIVLLAYPESGRKDEAEWLFVSHDTVDYEQVAPALSRAGDYSQCIYFRQESAILHVCCDSLESTQILISIAKEGGLKHSGIMSLRPRIMVELMGSEKLDAPVAADGRMLVEKSYVRKLIEIANSRLCTTREKIEKLRKRITALS